MSLGSLPRIRFDTTALPRHQQFDAWREAVGVTHDITSADPVERDGLTASSDVWRLGQMVVSHRRFPALRFARRVGRARSDGLDHYAVLLMREGSWVGDVDGREVTLRQGEIGLFDLARPVDNQVSTNASLRVMLPRERLEEVLRAGIDHGAVLQGAPARLLAEYLELTLRGLAELSAGQAPHVEQATMGMLAACLAPGAARVEAARPAIASTLLHKARRHIEAHLADPGLTPEAIGRAVGLSRSGLYRLFEPLGGVAAFIQTRRLARIRLHLAEPAEGRRISDLAYAYGFSSEVHFARAFRRAFGVSASEVRAGARAQAPAASTPGQLYNDWVRGG